MPLKNLFATFLRNAGDAGKYLKPPEEWKPRRH
jgi:hypothetical protein